MITMVSFLLDISIPDSQEEKGVTEDEMVEWHHRLYGHEFEQTLGDGEGQGSLACCSPWDHKELGTTEPLNNSSRTYSFQALLLRLG